MFIYYTQEKYRLLTCKRYKIYTKHTYLQATILQDCRLCWQHAVAGRHSSCHNCTHPTA